jgi:hypothetical protein
VAENQKKKDMKREGKIYFFDGLGALIEIIELGDITEYNIAQNTNYVSILEKGKEPKLINLRMSLIFS